MMSTAEDLPERLPQFKDNNSLPFVMNHGAVGEATDKNIVERREEIKLFLREDMHIIMLY